MPRFIDYLYGGSDTTYCLLVITAMYAAATAMVDEQLHKLFKLIAYKTDNARYNNCIWNIHLACVGMLHAEL